MAKNHWRRSEYLDINKTNPKRKPVAPDMAVNSCMAFVLFCVGLCALGLVSLLFI